MTDPAAVRQPAERPRFTSRAAVLAVVVCAIALSLAYPVREYIAQRRQIDQLVAQQQQIVDQLTNLRALQHEMSSPAYIERQAEGKLHMCPPLDTCYTVIPGKPSARQAATVRKAATPWYQRLWTSVKQADKAPAH
jgi:cell division protein FtsB